MFPNLIFKLGKSGPGKQFPEKGSNDSSFPSSFKGQKEGRGTIHALNQASASATRSPFLGLDRRQQWLSSFDIIKESSLKGNFAMTATEAGNQRERRATKKKGKVTLYSRMVCSPLKCVPLTYQRGEATSKLLQNSPHMTTTSGAIG